MGTCTDFMDPGSSCVQEAENEWMSCTASECSDDGFLTEGVCAYFGKLSSTIELMYTKYHAGCRHVSGKLPNDHYYWQSELDFHDQSTNST